MEGKTQESTERFDRLYIETVRNVCAIREITKMLGIDCDKTKYIEPIEQEKQESIPAAVFLLKRATEIVEKASLKK